MHTPGPWRATKPAAWSVDDSREWGAAHLRAADSHSQLADDFKASDLPNKGERALHHTEMAQEHRREYQRATGKKAPKEPKDEETKEAQAADKKHLEAGTSPIAGAGAGKRTYGEAEVEVGKDDSLTLRSTTGPKSISVSDAASQAKGFKDAADEAAFKKANDRYERKNPGADKARLPTVEEMDKKLAESDAKRKAIGSAAVAAATSAAKSPKAVVKVEPTGKKQEFLSDDKYTQITIEPFGAPKADGSKKWKVRTSMIEQGGESSQVKAFSSEDAAIAYANTLKKIAKSTKNSEGLDMTDEERTSIIDGLIANSCCWTEDDREELEGLTDNQLHKTQQAAAKTPGTLAPAAGAQPASRGGARAIRRRPCHS